MPNIQLCQNILNLLIKNVRVCDEVVCLKPGEFALLMPETNLEGGTVVLERVKKVVQSTLFHLEDHSLYLTLTTSHINLFSYWDKQGKPVIAAAFDINLDSIRQFNFHSVFNYFSRNIAYFPD